MGDFEAVGGEVPRANPGDIVVISGEGLDDLQVTQILTALGSVGYKGLIAGITIPTPEDPRADRSHLTTEVQDWRDRYGSSVDTRFLEEIAVADDPTVSRRMLTQQNQSCV